MSGSVTMLWQFQEQASPWSEVLCFGQANKKASTSSRVLLFLFNLDTYTGNYHIFNKHMLIAAPFSGGYIDSYSIIDVSATAAFSTSHERPWPNALVPEIEVSSAHRHTV